MTVSPLTPPQPAAPHQVIEMIAEWRRGCSIAGSTQPEMCPTCTVGLIDAIENRVRAYAAQISEMPTRTHQEGIDPVTNLAINNSTVHFHLGQAPSDLVVGELTFDHEPAQKIVVPTWSKIEKIKIGADGQRLPSDAKEWDAVELPEFGLMFSAADVPGGRMDGADADAACAALRAGGFNDWRQPDDFELFLTRDTSRYNPCSDPEYFKDTKPAYYRTRTVPAWSSDSVFVVHFYDGNVNDNLRHDEAFVRAVRSVAPAGQ